MRRHSHIVPRKHWTMQDGTCIAWHSSHPQVGLTERCLFFHGNAGHLDSEWASVADSLSILLSFDQVIVYDYRGFGASGGRSTPQNSLRDAQDIVGHILSSRPKELMLYGRSLGAAIAVQVAAKYPRHCVIFETPMLGTHCVRSPLVTFFAGTLYVVCTTVE